MTRTASDSRSERPIIRFAVGVMCILAAGASASAQAPISLRIEPAVGQTVRMRLDQRVEMSGTTRMPSGDSTASVVTTLLVISRTFVERRDRDASVLLSSTDSVAASSNGADSLIVATETRRALQGKKVRLRIAPDGATEILGGDIAGNEQLKAVFSQMPATLPNTPVAVGQSWSRVMYAPVGGGAGTDAGGKVQATFRLDSLSGDRAYVSLSGTITRPPAQKDGWATLTMSGTMLGGLVIDRKMRWISEAKMAYTVRSTLTPTSSSTAAAMRFRMKVTQWVRVVP
jgi:hypothetical protein